MNFTSMLRKPATETSKELSDVTFDVRTFNDNKNAEKANLLCNKYNETAQKYNAATKCVIEEGVQYWKGEAIKTYNLSLKSK